MIAFRSPKRFTSLEIKSVEPHKRQVPESKYTSETDTIELINIREVSDNLWSMSGNINGCGIFLLGLGGGSINGNNKGSNEIVDYYVFYSVDKDSNIVRTKLNIKDVELKSKNKAHFLLKTIKREQRPISIDDVYLYRDENNRIKQGNTYKYHTVITVKYIIYIDRKYIQLL